MNHRICQGEGECYGINAGNCPAMFAKAWKDGLTMLEKGLSESTAEWHIIVTHFPGNSITTQPEIQQLNEKYGIDLVFSGHTHFQRLGEDNNMTYIISGGGGGVTSDAGPVDDGHDT